MRRDDEDDLEIERLAEARRIASGLRAAAVRAIRFARRYRVEEGAGGVREKACVEQALTWRQDARVLAKGGGVPRPGLARARTPEAEAPGSRRTG